MEKRKFKYIALYEKLKDEYFSGNYAPGTAFPTEDEIVDKYQVSKTTVRKATKMLTEENLIDAQQGRGTYIRYKVPTKGIIRYSYLDNVSIRLNTGGPGITSDINNYLRKQPAGEECREALGLQEGAEAYSFQRLHIADGRIYSIVYACFRADMFPGLDQYLGKAVNILGTITEEYGINITHAEDSFDAVAADDETAQILGVEPGTALLLIRRITYSDRGPFEFSRTYLHPGIYKMTLHIDKHLLPFNFVEGKPGLREPDVTE